MLEFSAKKVFYLLKINFKRCDRGIGIGLSKRKELFTGYRSNLYGPSNPVVECVPMLGPSYGRTFRMKKLTTFYNFPLWHGKI